MKIAIAQTHSFKGQIQQNIDNHLHIITLASNENITVLIFPELSITNYEPTLAKTLATTSNDSVFDSLQKTSTKYKMIIGVGMPTKSKDGLHISMLIFHPEQKRQVYSKQILHADEKPYFICGNQQNSIEINGVKIGLGICFETLHEAHVSKTIKNDATIYIASVAKSKEGIEKAYQYFPQMAKKYNTPILLSNSIGLCDDFVSVGQSAVWNNDGTLLNQLDSKSQGILIYDTESNLVTKKSRTLF